MFIVERFARLILDAYISLGMKEREALVWNPGSYNSLKATISVTDTTVINFPVTRWPQSRATIKVAALELIPRNSDVSEDRQE